MIQCHEIGHSYIPGQFVLDRVNIALDKGSFTFLTGVSGAGKTTLMNILSLKTSPTRGEFIFQGRTVDYNDRTGLALMRRRIGVVHQDYKLIDHLTVFENVALPLRVFGMSDSSMKKQITELLEWVGLGKKLDTYPPSLSGGECQRLAVARSVIHKPEIILADEPTGSLDDEMGHRIMSLFVQLHEMETTILLATHNRNLIDKYQAREISVQENTAEFVS